MHRRVFFAIGQTGGAQLCRVAGGLDLLHQAELVGGEARLQQNSCIELLLAGEFFRLAEDGEQVGQHLGELGNDDGVDHVDLWRRLGRFSTLGHGYSSYRGIQARE
jgi:hypothetical protein